MANNVENENYLGLSNISEFIILTNSQQNLSMIDVNETNNNLQQLGNDNINEYEEDEVLNILKSWGLSNLYPILLENKIDLETLKCMERQDVHELLKNEALGTRIKFTCYLKQWLGLQGIQIREHGICCCSQTNQVMPTVVDEAVPKQLENMNSKGKIYLKDILKETVPGRSLLNLSENRVRISDENRYILVDSIVSYFINKNIRMGVNECKSVAEDIQTCFVGEISSVYFQRRPNMKSKGQLYDRYNNRISKLRSSSLMPKAERFRKSISNVENSTSELNISPEDGQKLRMDLKYNRDDNQIDDILAKWTASSAYRCSWISLNKDKNISSIVEDWPAYEQVYGPKLIEIDFQHLFPESDDIFLKFERFCSDVLPIMDSKIVEHNSKQMLKEFRQQKQTTNDARFCIILLLIHALIKPTTKSMDKSSKKLKKHTIKDSQNSFMVLCHSNLEVDKFRENQKKTKLLEKKNMQPCIFVIGNSLYSENQYFVICDDIRYKCVSILSAVNCTFKLFHVFNLEYPEESKAPWQFIQQYFYKIETQFDDAFPAVDLLISKLEKTN